MEVSYLLKRWSPVATLTFAIVVSAAALYLWRGARRWWRKGALVAATIITVAAAWFAGQNHFEWMFNPLQNTSFVNASDADFVADDDQVLSVGINGDAAAYPIRQIAYHHIVQDVVGGVPLVATY
jgi:hypothetical protein